MPDSVKLPERLWRQATVEDAKENTITVSFSSEEPYDRYFGMEVLGHNPGEVNLERLNSGNAPLLSDHRNQLTSIIGKVEKAWIENKRGRAEIRLADTDLAKHARTLMEQDMLSNVSVGYDINRFQKTENEDGSREYRAIEWTPHEISLVAVPADPTVGVGRAAPDEKMLTRSAEIVPFDNKRRAVMPDENKTEDQKILEDSARKRAVDAAIKKEQERTAAIAAYGDEFKEADGPELARKVIADKGNIDDLREAILKRQTEVIAAKEMANKTLEDQGKTEVAPESRKAPAFITKTGEKLEDFSFTRFIQHLDPNVEKPKTGPEMEWTKEKGEYENAQNRGGRHIPPQIWANLQERSVRATQRGQHRVLTTDGASSTTSISDLVQETHRADLYIDSLRQRPIVEELGAMIVPDLTGNVEIPRLSGNTTIQAVNEQNTAVTASDPTFDDVTLTPKEVQGLVTYSRKTVYTGNPAVEGIIIGDLNLRTNLQIDNYALNGSGASNQPQGVRHSSVKTAARTVSLGTNGGAFTFAKSKEALGVLRAANADEGRVAWLFTAKGISSAEAQSKDTGSGLFVVMNAMVDGLPARWTNNMPNNLSKGTGRNLAAAVLANWQDVILGYWGGVDVLVNPYSGQANRRISISVARDYDVAVRHGDSFVFVDDQTTT